MSLARFPRSPYDQVGGLVYVARMLDKLRLHAEGVLPESYHGNLGGGLDARCCHYLGVTYEAVKEQALAGRSDEEIVAWARATGAVRDEEDLEIWNDFMAKRGWRDGGTARLETVKAANGLGDRADIVTFFEFLDADEGRVPASAASSV